MVNIILFTTSLRFNNILSEIVLQEIAQYRITYTINDRTSETNNYDNCYSMVTRKLNSSVISEIMSPVLTIYATVWSESSILQSEIMACL